MVRSSEGATDEQIANELGRSLHAIEYRRRLHNVRPGPAVSSKEVQRQTLLTSRQLQVVARDLNICKPGQRRLRGVSHAELALIAEQAKTIYPEIEL